MKRMVKIELDKNQAVTMMTELLNEYRQTLYEISNIETPLIGNKKITLMKNSQAMQC